MAVEHREELWAERVEVLAHEAGVLVETSRAYEAWLTATEPAREKLHAVDRQLEVTAPTTDVGLEPDGPSVERMLG